MKKYILLFAALQFITNSFSQTPAEVGITEGQLSVSLTGGAAYTIPIAVPPGLNGVVPQINLVYNSQSGNGLAGYGWNVSGVSTISRIPSTKFHDNEIDAVDFDASDRFALDGQRLVLKNATQTYGAPGTIYETESFSNLKITAVGGSNNSPASFTVEYPDGSIASYSTTSLTDWAITYWQNAQGVRISYTYATSNNVLRISKISYGTLNTTPGINEINFGYTPRQRPEHSFVGGQSFLQDQLLSNIKVKGNTVGFRNYYLFHDPTSLGYQILKRVEEKTGDDTLAYNPLVFGYDVTGNNGLFALQAAVNVNVSGMDATNRGAVTGDFDGDGKTDIITYPIIGANAYGLFQVFRDMNPGTTSNAITIAPGVFKSIFASTWLNSNNKVAPNQGIVVVKNNASGGVDFNTFAYEGSSILLKSTKSVSYPTRIRWNGCVAINTNCTTVQITEPTNLNTMKYYSGDFNGDGISDVVALDLTTSQDIGCATCYIPPCPGGICNNVAMSFSRTNTYFIDLKNNITLTSPYQNVLDIPINAKIEVVDFNGDGKSDLMVIKEGIVRVYSLNLNNEFVDAAFYSNSGIKMDKPLLLGDYNGDGKTDFCIPQVVGQDNWNFYFSNGNYFEVKNGAIGAPYILNVIDYFGVVTDPYAKSLSEFSYIPLDINSDGKTDIIFQQNLTIESLSDSPQGTPQVTRFWVCENKQVNPNVVYFTYNYVYAQFGGIGRYPIPIFTNHNQVNKNLEYSLISDNAIRVFKSTKDNKIDVALKTITNGNGVLETISYKPLINETCSNTNCLPIYKDSALTESYPNTDIVVAPTFKVVSQIDKQSDNSFKKQIFGYYGAVSNMEGLGFQGFRGMTRSNWVDANSTNIISTVTRNNIALRGAPSESYSILGFYAPQNLTPTTNFITKSITTYNTDASNVFTPPLQANKVYKLSNTKSEQYNGLEGTSSSSVTVYDTNNNPTSATATIKNGTNTEQITTTTIGYYNSAPTVTPYIIGRPISKTQNLQIYPNQADADTTITKELYTYNPTQLLSKIEKQATNSGLPSNWLTEDNTYDAYGNITKKIITPFGETPRETNYQYSVTYGSRFMTKSIDVETLATEFTYDASKGLVLSQKLPSNAGYDLKTSYTYDKWGKKLTVTDYINQIKTFTYTNASGITTIGSSAADGSASSEIFDKLGRKTQSTVKNINAGTNLTTYQSYQYDIYDRATKTSDPFFQGDTPLQNETKYDQYGRIYQTIDSKGKTTTITYPTGTLSVIVSDGTKTKTTVKNALGNVISMTESPIGGTVTYKYFANGNLKQTSYEGFATTITQDSWGRKKTLDDPSAGLYSYDYNGFGETLKETTPKGFTEYTYSPVGKLLTKWVKDAITPTNTNIKSVYAYDDANTKLLQTITVTNPYDGDSSYLYGYDNFKRLNSTTETFTGAIPRSFIKNITFDSFGRVKTETNTANAHGKTSVKMTNNTYRYGYLYQIYEGPKPLPTTLWQQNTENARGQLTTADLGNGIAITNTYNTYGYVTKMKHDITATAVNVMTLDTDFQQQRGNLNSRVNSMFGWNESFGYDSQDRLLSWNNALGVQTTQTYAESGKITANTLGTYNYTKVNATPARPYQNTSVTLSTDGLADYGAIGNQTITYNAFKSPIQITDGNKKISFGYNAMQDRSIMYYGDSNATPSLRPYRKYYSGDGSMEVRYTKALAATATTPAVLEKVEFFTYIGGDAYSAPVVAIKVDTGVFNNFYLHRDYQGSILAITNQAGTKVEERLFDAWGTLIKLKVNGMLTALPTEGSGVAFIGLLIDRGYTGHEHLWSVGLVHMNARLYDAKLHRFLQPDNFVQDPSNTQSFNRYSYCMNNPLRFTDYSGESWWDDNWKTVVSVLAAVGTAVIIVASAGTATPFMIAIYAGTGAGAVGSMVSSGLNGGSIGDVLGAGVKGAFFGAVGGALGFAAGLAAPAGLINGLFYGATSNVVVGGVLNSVQDRPFLEGAGLSAVLGGTGGAAGGYYKAQAMGLNPITGTPKASVVAKNVNTSIEKAQIAFDKSTRTQVEPIDMSNTVANETPIFRGGSSTKLSPADIKSSVDQSGIAQPGKGGLSVNTNKFDTNVQKYGGAFEVNTKSLPNGLQILNKPVGSSHFIITPSYPMPQNVFQSLLNDVEILKLNSIRK